MDKLNLKTYQIPGLDKPNTNAIFNCGEIICGRINPFFEKEGNNKKFVYQEENDSGAFRITVEKLS
jgi:hypothetical protein